MLISPSILSCDLSRFAEEVKTISSADMIHIDVMDGVFVPNMSFGMPVISSLRNKTNMIFDVHLMITSPLNYIEQFVKSGSDYLTVHYESNDSVSALKKIKSLGVKAGLAIKPKTEINEIIPYLPFCDLVLVMTVEPGFGGQSLIEECTDKITELNKLKNEYGYNYLIEADGGIKQSNLEMLSKKGLESAVLGSAIFNLNANERNELIEELNKI